VVGTLRSANAGSTTGGITINTSTSPGAEGSATVARSVPGTVRVIPSGRLTTGASLTSVLGVSGMLAKGGGASTVGGAGPSVEAHDHVQLQSQTQVSGVPVPAEVEIVVGLPQKSNVQLQLQGSPEVGELLGEGG
jgi:hypothetical protein